MRFGQNYATQATESRIDLMPLGLEIMETTTKTGPVAACVDIDLHMGNDRLTLHGFRRFCNNIVGAKTQSGPIRNETTQWQTRTLKHQ
jgi:hypothetical protein